jgi:N-glycosylase/DNA lyase
MKLRWEISQQDVQLVKATIARASNNSLVADRRARNLANNKPPVDRPRLWKALLCMRLTSQQRSGPNSPVARFSGLRPFPLTWQAMLSNSELPAEFIEAQLQANGCTRMLPTIVGQMQKNFAHLNSVLGELAIDSCNKLTGRADAPAIAEERDVANYIAAVFSGIGPKQARNILQALGLTRFEIPIDSRVGEWLQTKLQFPLPIKEGDQGAAINHVSGPRYYEVVMDAIQELCRAADEFPCVLDAAIFSEGDEHSWTPEQLVY